MKGRPERRVTKEKLLKLQTSAEVEVREKLVFISV
jgi:hypothetical protein